MDPDEVEVESAGVHSHDSLTDTPLSAGGGGGTGSWACHLLRRGWDLTQKAAIAGAAATAAPVVAPPLIVLSAAGVALSVPFAAYLASLAATNHLMDALLRSCYPPTQPYYHQQDDDDVEQEFLDASEEYGRDAPAFGYLDTETEQGEENEGETSLLLPRHLDFSEASSAADAEEAEVEGELSARESYTSDRGDETEERTPVEGKEGLPRGFGVSASAMPLFSDEDSQVQKKGEGEFSVLDSGKQSFQSENWNAEEEDSYSKNKEDDGETMEENRYRNETVSQGFDFPEPRVPAFGGEDNAVQEKGEGEFSVQDSGQKSFQSKNWNENKEEDDKTTEENKSTKATLSQGFYFTEQRVPASGDDDNVVQEKGGGELSAQNLDQHSLLSNTGDEIEQAMTMEEKKSTEDILPQDFVVSESSVPVFHGEDDVVKRKEGFEVADLGVVEEANSNADLVMGEVADVQVEIISIAPPESEVLPPINLAARESPVDLVTEEVVVVDVGIAAAAEPESEVLHAISESAADPVTGESVDVQLEIISIAAPESEVLPLSNAHESPLDLVTGEVVDVYVGTAAAAKPESEVLHPTSESPADPVTGQSVDVQIDTVGATAPGSEVLPLSSLAACESQAVVETAHVGEAIGITEIIKDFGDVSKEDDAKTMEENKYKSTSKTVSQGFCFPKSHVQSSVDDDTVVQEKGEGEFSAQIGQYSLLPKTGDKSEQGMTMEERKSTEDIRPRDVIVSESPASVFHGEDDVVRSNKGFEVAVQEVMEEANSTADPDMGEVADVQVEIIAIAAPETESEVLPASNVVARESLADLVAEEVIDVCIGIAAAVEPETGVLHPSNLATSESPANPVTGEIVDVQVDIVAAAAPGSVVLPLGRLAACESEAVAETAHVGEVIEITVTEDIVRDFGDANKEGVSLSTVALVHDGEDVMSSGSTRHLSTVEEEMIDQPNESTGVGYAVMNEAFGSRDIAEGEAHYTEEQLREQLDTIRTITGYSAVPSSTLEGELAGLYLFVGVEPAVASGDTSDRLMELNATLRFLESIIGVD